MTLFLLAAYALVASIVLISIRLLKRSMPRFVATTLVALPVLFCLPGFARGRTALPVDHVRLFAPWSGAGSLPPGNADLNDVVTQFAPWAKAVRMAWKEGSLPFRNRWNGCGSPLAANGQSAAFSPFTFAMAVLPLASAFTLLMAGKLFLALAGTWLWLRELGASVNSALFAAIAFAFSMTMTPLLLMTLSGVFCLWPWAVFAIELVLSPDSSVGGFILLVAVLATWVLIGHPETACLGMAGVGVFLLGRLLVRDPKLRPSRLLAILAAGVLAGGLTAFLWLPELRAIRSSSRYVSASEFRAGLLGHPPHLPGWSFGFATSIFPRVLGDGTHSPRRPDAHFGFVEMGLAYFGIAGWSLALLILRPGARRESRELALLFPLLCGLAISTGTWPVAEGFLSFPLINLVFPSRFFSWVALFGSAIAAFELDRFAGDAQGYRWTRRLAPLAPLLLAGAILVSYFRLRPPAEASGGLASVRAGLVAALATLAAVAALFVWSLLRPKFAPRLGILMAAIGAAELLFQALPIYRWGQPDQVFPPTSLGRFLDSQKRPFRVVGEGSALFPATNVFAGVEEIRVHDPVEPLGYVEFLDRTCGYDPKPYFKQIRDSEASVLDFLNVRYLVSAEPARGESARWRRIYSGQDGSVLENARALPRVFAPRRIRVLAGSRGSASHSLSDFGEEGARIVSRSDWSGEASVLAWPGDSALVPGEFSNPEVSIDRYVETTNRVTFRAQTAKPAVVVASLANDGGWTARDAGGSPIPVVAANGPFLGIPLKAGENEIRMSYVPPGFLGGVSVSAITGLLVVLAGGLRLSGSLRQGRTGGTRS